ALGKFLAAAESGRVPRGSYLLVESLDRISRQKPEIAQALFLRILAAGINLVTLADKHVYRSGNTDIGELIVSLIKLNVANEESENKSFRVGAAWKNKRVDAKALKPMTALCPGWLKLSDSRKTYELRADRAELVRRIFHEAANGIGASAIASRLNSESISPFGKSNGWRKSYVVKILNSRAVLGEFQPHTLRSNKRVEDGEPILNYFPRVVDDATFFKAQTGRAQRRTGGGGRKGKYVSNLFSGMTKCGHCGGTVVFENKGSSPKGGQYLVCDNAKRKLGCSAKRWRYADFELSFLTFVQEIDLAKILQPSSDSDARTATEAEIAVLKGNIALIKERRERTFELFEKGMATEYIADKLREQEELLASLTAELTVKTNELTELAHEINAFGTGKDDIIELLERLPSQGGGDLYKIRSTIAARLKALIRFLEISTLGVQQEARNEAAAYKLS
ncbi:MAG: recombinase family protein, partial [Afipia sp.]|nr:recombinase family protein [Afipia sp.]